MIEVAIDTSMLVNFLVVDRVGILAQLPEFRFHVVDHVIAEVTREPQRSRLQAAMSGSQLSSFQMTDPSAIADYAALTARLGDGEAATIAAAAHLRWAVGLDEKGRARREAVARVGMARLVNTAGILVRSVQDGHLSLNDAEQIRTELAAHRFLIKDTIAALLGRE